MKNIKFINKALIIEEKGKKILVVSDIHLGFFESIRSKGSLIPGGDEEIKELEILIENNGKIDELVILGDLKHEFGKIYSQEKEQIKKLIELCNMKNIKLILIKGNHDVMISFVKEFNRIEIKDNYVFGEYALIHGDKEIKEIENKKIKYWILGHGHPAVKINDGYKEEKYKCFLVGSYKDKKIIIMPSFFNGNIGTDPREFDMKLGWKINLNNFEVKVVNDNGEIIKFGKLKDINFSLN